MHIDINCDIAEGNWPEGKEQIDAMMPFVTSANIACNFHAGDPSLMLYAIDAALENGVQIGAHPAYPDREGFGRRELAIAPEELYAMILYQIAALHGMAATRGANLSHVKAHGALYNRAAVDEGVAQCLVRAVNALDPHICLIGLSGSAMEKAALETGMPFIAEFFTDRAYDDYVLLVHRSIPGAVLHDHPEMIRRVLQMLQTDHIYSIQGKLVKVKGDTLCIHGDHPEAVAFAKKLKSALLEAGIEPRPFQQ